MDRRTGRVADGRVDLHTGGLPLLRHGKAALGRLGSRTGHGLRCGCAVGSGSCCRLCRHSVQHLGHRAAGFPGGADCAACITEAAAQRRNRCGDGGCRGCGSGRTQRGHVLCSHTGGKIRRREHYGITLYPPGHVELRQLYGGLLRFLLHGDKRCVKARLLRHRGQWGLKLCRLRQFKGRLGTDLLRGIVGSMAADGTVDQGVQLINGLLGSRCSSGRCRFLGRL